MPKHRPAKKAVPKAARTKGTRATGKPAEAPAAAEPSCPAIAPQPSTPTDPRAQVLNALARKFMASAAGNLKPVEAAIISRAALDLQSVAGPNVGLNAFAPEQIEQFLAMALFEAALGRRPTVKPVAAKFLLANLFPERWSMLPQFKQTPAATPAAGDDAPPSDAPPFSLRLIRA